MLAPSIGVGWAVAVAGTLVDVVAVAAVVVVVRAVAGALVDVVAVAALVVVVGAVAGALVAAAAV